MVMELRDCHTSTVVTSMLEALRFHHKASHGEAHHMLIHDGDARWERDGISVRGWRDLLPAL